MAEQNSAFMDFLNELNKPKPQTSQNNQDYAKLNEERAAELKLFERIYMSAMPNYGTVIMNIYNNSTNAPARILDNVMEFKLKNPKGEYGSWMRILERSFYNLNSDQEALYNELESLWKNYKSLTDYKLKISRKRSYLLILCQVLRHYNSDGIDIVTQGTTDKRDDKLALLILDQGSSKSTIKDAFSTSIKSKSMILGNSMNWTEKYFNKELIRDCFTKLDFKYNDGGEISCTFTYEKINEENAGILGGRYSTEMDESLVNKYLVKDPVDYLLNTEGIDNRFPLDKYSEIRDRLKAEVLRLQNAPKVN